MVITSEYVLICYNERIWMEQVKCHVFIYEINTWKKLLEFVVDSNGRYDIHVSEDGYRMCIKYDPGHLNMFTFDLYYMEMVSKGIMNKIETLKP